MKIKSFFLSILVTLAFSACNNEVLNPTPDQEKEQPEGYLVLNLTNPSTTRATDQGTTEENKINTLTVVLTDAAGNIKFVDNPDIKNGVPEKFKVALGTYHVYALVNSPTTVSVGQNIERVITVAAATEATSGYKNGSFFMVNQRSRDSENAGVITTVDATNSITNPARASIYVDRVVGKIVDATENENINAGGLTATTGGIINGVDIVGFEVLNVNKKFNLIQTWNTNNADGIPLGETKVLSTPLYPGGEEDLVADQYFHNIGNYTTLTKPEGKITAITVNPSNTFDKKTVYTTENRPTIIGVGETAEITAGRGETTGVIYKVQAKKGENNSGTFYTYQNNIYDDVANIQALPDFKNETLPSEIPALRALGIKVYENGVMYYTYFIAAHKYEGKNYYGVFRNSLYELVINSISSLGDDVPGGAIVDPTESGEAGNPLISTDEAYMEVTLTVNPWIVYTLGIGF